MHRVVIVDCNIEPFDYEREELEGIASLKVAQCVTEDDVVREARDAEGILVQFAPITPRVIASLGTCRVVARYGVGVDTINLEAARNAGIAVANVPLYCVDEVSDHACALILAVSRAIAVLDSSVRSGVWNARAAGNIPPLRGRTLGLLGFGAIAQRVCEKLTPFGVKAIAYDPYLEPALFDAQRVESVTLESLLERSHVISCHLPLTAETTGMIGKKEFGMMRSDAILVNTSRGGVIDEEALVDALSKGRLCGAGLDVFQREPLPIDHPLRSLRNVIITPHCAYYSEQSLERMKRHTARAVASVLTGRAVDPSDLFRFIVPPVRKGMPSERPPESGEEGMTQ